MSNKNLEQQYNKHKSIFLKGAQEYDAKSRTIFHQYINQFGVQGKRILGMGCGDASDLLILQQQGAEVFGIDASKEMIQKSQKLVDGGKFYVCDFTQTPFDEEYFDIIVTKITSLKK